MKSLNLMEEGDPEASESSRSNRMLNTAFNVLGETSSFPNLRINLLMKFVKNILHDKQIRSVLNPDGEVKDLYVNFNFPSEESEPAEAIFMVPRNFAVLVQEDPLYHLGSLVKYSSCMKDFCSGVMAEDVGNGSFLNLYKRADANVAEFLLTIQAMLARKGYDTRLEIDRWQAKALQEYPQGLDSLDSAINYPTPIYDPTMPFLYPSSLN